MLEEDDIFEPGRRVILSPTERETEIESFRRQHGRCVAKFRGIDSISEAEKYIGNEVRIRGDEIPVLKEGWFYTFQLKGCRVLTTNGEYVGIVTEVLGSGGSQVLKVECENEETLIPFAQSYVKQIDLEGRKIEVDLPEDLRTLNK